MIDSTLLAEVFVENNQGKLNTATGYLITPNRIITTAHVLDDQKPDGKIKIRLYREGEETRSVNLVAWDGRSHSCIGDAPPIDVCVLETDPHDRLGQPAYFLCQDPLNETLDFEGRGFPAICRVEKRPQAESFSGKCSHFDPSTPDRTIFLGCRGGFTNRADWQGASGFPVFHRDVLIAIAIRIKDIDKEERNLDTIECVPLSRLLASYPTFGGAIEFDRYIDRKRRFDAVHAEVLEILSGQKGQSDHLSKRFDQLFHERVVAIFGKEAFADGLPKALTNFLLRIDPRELLEAIDDIHAETCQSDAPEGTLDQLDHLYRLILPVAVRSYLDGLVRVCRSAQTPLSAPFALKTTAEIFMAVFEDRALSFVIRDTENGNLSGTPSAHGTHQLLVPADLGMEGDDDKYVGEILSDLVRVRSPLRLDIGTLENIEKNPQNNQKKKNETIAKYLSYKLHRILTRKWVSGPKHYYYAVDPCDDERTAAGLGRVICELKRLVPELVILNLGREFLKLGEGDEVHVSMLIAEIMQRARRGSSP